MWSTLVARLSAPKYESSQLVNSSVKRRGSMIEFWMRQTVKSENNQMHILSTLSMFRKFVGFVSQRLMAIELKHSSEQPFVVALSEKKTIENNILALDIEKWRIAHTFVVYKSDDS